MPHVCSFWPSWLKSNRPGWLPAGPGAVVAVERLDVVAGAAVEADDGVADADAVLAFAAAGALVAVSAADPAAADLLLSPDPPAQAEIVSASAAAATPGRLRPW